ncbi:MAG: type II toxin-antitoxin system PemK/MazF family toxin [Chlamydiia bacterium]|nr:type II toxin-antitoxin system PemK/MazF family toxin [Chlamydiia bacterium]
MASKSSPLQGEVWLFDPDPVKGSELGKKVRPALIISNNAMNKGPSGLVIVVPMTSKNRNIPSHIRLNPPEGGVSLSSFAMCEQIRSISKERLVKKLGKVQRSLLVEVDSWLRDLLWID